MSGEALLPSILRRQGHGGTRSAAMLDAIAGGLSRDNRVLMSVLGLVFGTWFLVKALTCFGVLETPLSRWMSALPLAGHKVSRPGRPG